MNDQQRLSMAETFKELSTDVKQSYWSGYMRGTRAEDARRELRDQ